MSGGLPADQTAVRTLRDAHRLVSRQWPGRHATADAFRAYHERAARIYERVARVDADHHHEALYWAQQARQNAEDFAGQVRDSPAPEGSAERRHPGGCRS